MVEVTTLSIIGIIGSLLIFLAMILWKKFGRVSFDNFWGEDEDDFV